MSLSSLAVPACDDGRVMADAEAVTACDKGRVMADAEADIEEEGATRRRQPGAGMFVRYVYMSMFEGLDPRPSA